MNLKRMIVPGIALTLSLAISVGVLASTKADTDDVTASAGGAAPRAVVLANEAGADSKATPSYPTGVSSESDFEYAKKGYRNAYEELMDRDGFLYGIEYDWFDGLTWSLGDNELLNHRNEFSYDRVYTDLYNMKALGFNAANFWLFSALQGMTFDHETGYVTGLQQSFRDNLTELLNIARELDMKMVLSIQPHGNFEYGDTPSGLSAQDVYVRYLQPIYNNPEAQKMYMDNAITPLCEDILKYYQDTVIICDITVENGCGEVDDDNLGMYYGSENGTTWENFGGFVKEMNRRIKAVMPNMMTSSEDMWSPYSIYKYNDLGLDLHGINIYDNQGQLPDQAEHFSNTPMYISEVNVSENQSEHFSDEYWLQRQQAFYPNAQAQGYIGCFYFCWWAGGPAFAMFDGNTRNYDGMHTIAGYLSYQFNDLKNRYYGTQGQPDKPVLLANRGGQDVYWLPGREMTRFKLERSDDGGKTYHTVAENLTDGEGGEILTNGLYKYHDNTVKAGVAFQYRVTAYNDESGVSTVSLPNNAKELFVAQDLMKDGSFEAVNTVDALPYNDNFADAMADSGWVRSGGTIGAVSSTAPQDGGKCLEIDTANGKGETGWVRLNQKLTVTPGATYQATFWYKDIDCTGDGALIASEARTVAGEFITGSWITKSIEENAGKWVQTSYTFTAPADGEVIIQLINYSWGTQKGFIDNFSVKELR